MLKLSIEDIISNITSETVFEAVSETYSFTIKVEAYVPYICAAVHDGGQFRKSLWDNCLHSAYERWYEEDPCTKEMIQSHPIVIAGCDSRFEYDLNRSPETAIYTDAWGKQLWKRPLSITEQRQSLEKHAAFYKVVHALVKKIEQKYSHALVYDMHSYNWKRWDREVPTWNLGTTNIDHDRFGDIVESWRATLEKVQLPNEIKSSSKINDTFQGNGYFLRYITGNFKNTLVLATEIAKIYCDEDTGIYYPEVVKAVATQLKELIPLHAKAFQEHMA